MLLDEFAVERLGDQVEVAEWRQDQTEAASLRRFAVLAGLKTPAAPAPWPVLQPEQFTEAQIRPWVHQPLVERLQAGMGMFLTELRPTVAIFLRFSGIDYDNDPLARSRLNEYISAVQQLLSGPEGYLLDITVGDKGSYLYISFGACVSHEDDARRHLGAVLGDQLRIGPDCVVVVVVIAADRAD